MRERVSQRDGTYLVLLRLPQQTQNRTILSINEDEVPLFLFFFFLFPPRFEPSKNSARRVRFGTRFGGWRRAIHYDLNASLARVAVVCDSK